MRLVKNWVKNAPTLFKTAADETRAAFERLDDTGHLALDESLQLDFCLQCARAMIID